MNEDQSIYGELSLNGKPEDERYLIAGTSLQRKDGTWFYVSEGRNFALKELWKETGVYPQAYASGGDKP